MSHRTHCVVEMLFELAFPTTDKCPWCRQRFMKRQKKKNIIILADEKDRALRIVKELGGECTIYEFMDKYKEVTGSEIKRMSACRLLERIGLEAIKEKGKTTKYKLKVEQP